MMYSYNGVGKAKNSLEIAKDLAGFGKNKPDSVATSVALARERAEHTRNKQSLSSRWADALDSASKKSGAPNYLMSGFSAGLRMVHDSENEEANAAVDYALKSAEKINEYQTKREIENQKSESARMYARPHFASFINSADTAPAAALKQQAQNILEVIGSTTGVKQEFKGFGRDRMTWLIERDGKIQEFNVRDYFKSDEQLNLELAMKDPMVIKAQREEDRERELHEQSIRAEIEAKYATAYNLRMQGNAAGIGGQRRYPVTDNNPEGLSPQQLKVWSNTLKDQKAGRQLYLKTLDLANLLTRGIDPGMNVLEKKMSEVFTPDVLSTIQQEFDAFSKMIRGDEFKNAKFRAVVEYEKSTGKINPQNKLQTNLNMIANVLNWLEDELLPNDELNKLDRGVHGTTAKEHEDLQSKRTLFYDPILQKAVLSTREIQAERAAEAEASSRTTQQGQYDRAVQQSPQEDKAPIATDQPSASTLEQQQTQQSGGRKEYTVKHKATGRTEVVYSIAGLPSTFEVINERTI